MYYLCFCIYFTVSYLSAFEGYLKMPFNKNQMFFYFDLYLKGAGFQGVLDFFFHFHNIFNYNYIQTKKRENKMGQSNTVE